METVIHGTSLVSPSFHAALHAALTALIHRLGVTAFNVGILGMNAVSSDLAADFLTTKRTSSADASAQSCEGVTAR